VRTSTACLFFDIANNILNPYLEQESSFFILLNQFLLTASNIEMFEE